MPAPKNKKVVVKKPAAVAPKAVKAVEKVSESPGPRIPVIKNPAPKAKPIDPGIAVKAVAQSKFGFPPKKKAPANRF